MSETGLIKKGITRRSFLKTTAAVGGVAALSGSLTGCGVGTSNTQGGISDDEFFVGCCRGNCAGGCRLKIKVRNDKVVQTEMEPHLFPEFNRICSKGLSHPQRTYSTARIQYPMRQTGEKGSGQWVRITWDEALDEIVTKWKQYQKESGNNSVVFSSSTGQLAVGKDIYSYLAKLMGATTTAICYDGAGLAMLMKAAGYGKFGSSSPFGTERDSRVVFLVGANAHLSLVQNFHFLQEAQELGAKLIHIDPVYSLTSQKCDQFVPIVPGTDAALFLAMTKYVIDQGWADKEYLKKATVAPFLVKEDTGHYLRMSDLGVEPTVDPVTKAPVDPTLAWDQDSGQAALADTVKNPALEGTFEVEGIKVRPVYQALLEHLSEWSIEKAASICEIPEEKIRELTDLFVHEGPSTVYMGFGIDHYNGGHKSYQAIITFLAVTGQYGKPGAGITGVSSGSNVSLVNPALTVTDVTPGPVIGTVKLATVKENKSLGNIPLDIRSIFFYIHNYVSNVTDRKRAIEFVKNVDFVVVADLTMNDTSEYADIVLPVCGWMETEDVFCGGPSPFVCLQEKAIEPLYESKSDFDIGMALIEKMGFSSRAKWTQEEYFSGFFDNAWMQAMGYTYEKLRVEKTFALTQDGRSSHGEGGVLPTSTGKLQFYIDKFAHSVSYEGMSNGDKVDEKEEQFATFVPPNEAWKDNPLIEKYPLQYMSNRNRFRTHTQFFEIPWLHEIVPEPTLRLNPLDAAARDIKNGDYVRAFNDRGYVVLKAEIDNGIKKGIVTYPKGWQASQIKDGHISDLTSDYTIPSMYNNYYFDTLCEVEKVD